MINLYWKVVDFMNLMFEVNEYLLAWYLLYSASLSKEIDNSYCIYHQYTIKIENRDEVHKLLQENGVGAMIYYPVPLHLQKLHKELGYKVGDLPLTEENTKLVMSLPMFPELTEEEQKTVVETVVKCLNMTKQAV